ncbi:MAG: DNA polymerase III subunit epsilon [Burkholderiales bacterium]|nr:MAG: DNA polymerase III subunit epsilon [Burkholderiales bacterium]
MRQVVLDTETTGLSASEGHRIIEIGCLEIVNRRLTGRTLHLYLNPEREIDEAATEVHGMTWDDLRDKPRFAEVAERVLAFCEGAEVLIHNAAFDLSFLDAELGRVDLGRFRDRCASVLDTLLMARELHPGKRNSLDALCDRYGVSNAHRTLHGALLDSELLAEVYLAMTRGQDSFEIALDAGTQDGQGADAVEWPPRGLRVLPASAAEAGAHEAALAVIAKERKGTSIWASEPAQSA